jgi:hypothetical protein
MIAYLARHVTRPTRRGTDQERSPSSDAPGNTSTGS